MKKTVKKYVPKKKAKTTVKDLSKKVTKLAKQLKEGTEIQHLYGSYISTIATDYYALNLCNYVNLVGCFGSTGNDYNFVNKWKSNYFVLDLLLYSASEPANVTVSAYIVSLKDSAGTLS